MFEIVLDLLSELVSRPTTLRGWLTLVGFVLAVVAVVAVSLTVFQ